MRSVRFAVGGALGVAALALGASACRGALPRPPAAQVAASDYVPVPFGPRVPPIEYVPPSPAKGAVWIDGSWDWSGTRYVWRYGTWVVPPPGVRRARWVTARRPDDGQLFFAPSTWKDEQGKLVDDRDFRTALGPSARARTRLGAPPPALLDERDGRAADGGARRSEREETMPLDSMDDEEN